MSNLYSGYAGVVLFFVELARQSGDVSYLDDARRGGDHLVATEIPEEIEQGYQAGLYTGVAGVGFVLDRLGLATGGSATPSTLRRRPIEGPATRRTLPGRQFEMPTTRKALPRRRIEGFPDLT